MNMKNTSEATKNEQSSTGRPPPSADDGPARAPQEFPAASPGLRVRDVPSGRLLTARVSLDPTAGRVRIDWALRPGVGRGLRVSGGVDGQVLFCGCGRGGRYDAIWQPGEYVCRIEAAWQGGAIATADHVGFCMKVPQWPGSLRCPGVASRRPPGDGCDGSVVSAGSRPGAGGVVKVQVRRRADTNQANRNRS